MDEENTAILFLIVTVSLISNGTFFNLPRGDGDIAYGSYKEV